MAVYGIKLPDGRYAYFLERPKNTTRWNDSPVFADGEEMTLMRPGRNEGGFCWFVTDHEAQEIFSLLKQPSRLLHFKLDDMTALSEKYPEIISTEDWDVRSHREENLYELYTGVYETLSPVEYVWEGPYTLLEGREPLGPDDRTWVADLPYELKERPEYRHLFPGKIPGLRSYLHEVIKKMPGVQYCFLDRDGVRALEVVIQVPYEPSIQKWQAYTGSRGQKLKTGRYVPEYATRRLVLPVPSYVNGPDYETALVLWNQAVKYWMDQVEEASVVACAHCKGTGQVPDGATQYEKPKGL